MVYGESIIPLPRSEGGHASTFDISAVRESCFVMGEWLAHLHEHYQGRALSINPDFVIEWTQKYSMHFRWT